MAVPKSRTALAIRTDAIEVKLSQSVIALYLAEPFFAHVAHGLIRRVDDSTPTLAVALCRDGIELRVNPTFFGSLGKNERVAVIKHEVLHIVLKHIVRGQGLDPARWNIACDIVVNELIGHWPLPAGAITRAAYRDLNIPPDATAEQVYKRLKDATPTADSGTGRLDGVDSAPVGARGKPRANASIDHPSSHSDHRSWAGRLGANGREGDAIRAGTVGHAAEITRPVAEASIDGLLIRAASRLNASSYGSLPGLVRDAISEARARGEARIDWRRTLRLFSSGAGRTRIVATVRRESPRYGTFPGTKIKRLHHLAVVIDTSGSVSDLALQVFFDEIHALWRTGTSVLVVMCDAAVHDSFTYQGRRPASLGGGGGGTAFQPAFDWIREQRRMRVDGCVYLTDGDGPAPTTGPGCRLLWVVTNPKGLGSHLRHGRSVLLDLE